MRLLSMKLPLFDRLLSLTASALLALLLGTVLPGLESQAQTTPGLGVLEQVELTEDAAKSALRAYAELKAEFKDQAPAGSDAQTFAQAMIARGTMTTALAKHGFSDVQAWYRTLTSFIIAYSAGVEGKMEDMKKSMQQLRDTPNLPEATKQQMIAQLSALLPSERNLAVAQSVSADPEFAGIIAEIKN